MHAHIKNYDLENSTEYSTKKEKEIKEKLYKLSSESVDSSLKKELENLKIEIDTFLLNKDRTNDIEYKNKVLECITIKEINRISNSDWKQAKEQIKQIDEMIIKTKGLLDLLNTTLLDGTFENNIEIDGYQEVVAKIYQKNK